VSAAAARLPPSEDLGEDLDRCLQHMSFDLCWTVSTGPHVIRGPVGEESG
jgi:hypothetical protein